MTWLPELGLEDGVRETRRLISRATEEAAANPAALIVVDTPPGAGKTAAFLEVAKAFVTQGRSATLFQPRHELMDETQQRFAGLWAERGGVGPEPSQKLEGRARLCHLGPQLKYLSQYADIPEREVCGACPEVDECRYPKQWHEIGGETAFVLAPHQMATAVAAKGMLTGGAWFDELPNFLEVIEFSAADIRAVRDGRYLPASDCRKRTDSYREFYGERRPFAEACLHLIDEAGDSLSDKHYRDICFGTRLHVLLDAVRPFSSALDYDLNVGRFPGIVPGEVPIKGLHVRREFDWLKAAFLRLLDKKESLIDGVVGIFRDRGDDRGVLLLKRSQVLPAQVGCVVAAAGASLLGPCLSALYPERSVKIRQVEVRSARCVSHMAVRGSRFGKQYLRDDEERQRSIRQVMLRILPTIILWGGEVGRDRLAMGIACPKELRTDFEAGDGPVREAVDLYERCGIYLHGVGHYGNLDGINEFAGVAVWIRFGEFVPNLATISLLAHGLRGDGARIHKRDLLDAFVERNEVQNEGRARPIVRTEDRPLLSIKVGLRVDEYGSVLKTRGQPLKPHSVYLELLASSLVEYRGGCSVPMMRDLHRGLEPAERKGMCHYWKNYPSSLLKALRALRLYSFNNKDTSSLRGFNRRLADRVLHRLSEAHGLAREERVNAAGTGSEIVHCLEPGRPQNSILRGLRKRANENPFVQNGTTIFPSLRAHWGTLVHPPASYRVLDLEEQLLQLPGALDGGDARSYPYSNLRHHQAGPSEERAQWLWAALEQKRLVEIYQTTELPFVGLLLTSFQAGLPVNMEELARVNGQDADVANEILADCDRSSHRLKPRFGWTRTGRVSTKGKAHQNLPRRMRHVVQAESGSLLLCADYTAYELCILGGLSGDPALLSAMDDHKDFYSYLARQAVPDGSAERKKLKAFLTRVLNGANYLTTAEDVGLTPEHAEVVLHMFEESYPTAIGWLDEVCARVLDPPHVVRNPFGRFHWFPNLKSCREDEVRPYWQVVSHLVQGTGADVFKRALLRLQPALPEGVQMLLPIHDAVLLEVPQEKITETARICRDVMEAPVPEVPVRLRVAVEAGKNWGEMEPV